MSSSQVSGAAIVLVFVLWAAPALRAEDSPKVRPDVVYGHKDGMALTFDVVSPAEPSGAAVMLIQSGGWYSRWVDPKLLLPICKPLLDKGLTVFIVRHGSAPKYTVPEAVDDMRRSVRFIRLHAQDYRVDPARLGATGGSAGGHLALMLATTGDDGDPAAKEDVLKQSSRIAAAVALFPPTDIRHWTTNPPEAIKRLPQLKPPLTFPADKEKDVSPILHLTPDDAPMLMIHGDKDELVPLSHSEKLLAASQTAKAPAELLVIEGAGHGYNAQHNLKVVPALVGWFEKHLAKKSK